MAYFERLWSQMPETTPEHFALREAFLRSHLRPGLRMLDLGCGEGWFSAVAAQAGACVVGVDVAEEPLRRARARHPELDFVRSGERLSFADGAFDLVWAGELLEHVQDGLGLLWEAARVLRAGGRLLVSTPDHRLLRRVRLAVWRPAFDAYFEPRSDHVRFFTASSLSALLRDGGFERITTRSAQGVLLADATRSGEPFS